mgnify:CR=1 FL=1
MIRLEILEILKLMKKVKLESIKNNFYKKLMKYDLCLKEYLELD